MKIITYRKKNDFGGQSGQALVTVLMLLALGSIIIGPLLSYTATGLKAGQTYDIKADEQYAADAGIEYGLWLIENDRLGYQFPDYDQFAYYEYDGTQYHYSFPTEQQVNGKLVDIDIRNIWIPYGIDAPEADEARMIIEGYIDEYGEEQPPKLVVTGKGDAPILQPDGSYIGTFTITITFTPGEGEQTALKIQTVGVWLPPGFEYYTNYPDSYVGTFDNPYAHTYSPDETNIDSYNGGTVAYWYFSNYPYTGSTSPALEPFPGVALGGGAIEKSTITFYYKTSENKTPECISWVDTSGTSVNYAWDADVKVYGIHSVATTPAAGTRPSSSTTIDAYTLKSEMRELVGATSGDYYATGDAFLYAAGGPLSDSKYRDVMYSSGEAVVGSVETSPPNYTYDPLEGIPDNGAIVYAYLYWTGWIDNDGYTDPGGMLVWSDDCSLFTNWDRNDSDGSQDNVPTGDGASTGNWATSPYWSKVAETIPDDSASSIITGTRTSGTQTRTAVPNGDGDISGIWATGASTQTGWISPSSNAADSGGDNNGFESNPTRAYDDGGTGYASNVDGAGDRHRYWGYDTSAIPAGSIILGIEVRLDWWLDSTSGTNSMSVELSWNGGTSWTSAETDTSESTSTSHSTTLGSASDTWGHTWTTTELNSSNFRVRLTCNSNNSSRDFYLDWVPIRITYAPTGNLFSQVDETSPNDTDYITGITDGGGYCLFTFPQFNIPAGASIDRLTIYVRARDASSGSNNIRAYIKVNGSYYSAGSVDPGTSWTTYNDSSPGYFYFSNNPNTGQPWTVDDINGTGANPLQQFGVYSNDLNPDIQVSMVYAQVSYTLNGGTMLFNYTPFTVPAGATNPILTVHVRAKDQSSSITNNIAAYIKVGGSYYSAGSVNPDSSWDGNTFNIQFATNPKTGLAWTVDDLNGTGANPLQQFGVYSSDFGSTTNGIQVSMVYATVSWSSSSQWSLSASPTGRFQCTGSATATTEQRTLTLKNSIDLSAYAGETVQVTWDQYNSGNLEAADKLYCAFYSTATGWSSNYLASSGNAAPGTPLTIPATYLTSSFKMRFYFYADATNEYIQLDNIKIVAGGYTDLKYTTDPEDQQALVHDNARVDTVKFGISGWDYEDMVNVEADNWQIIEPFIDNGSGGNAASTTWSYCCVADVTDLVTEWIENGDLETNGTGTYEVANAWVNVANELCPSYSWSFADGGSTGYPLGTPADTTLLKDQNCHSGWSLILIYSAVGSKGHQLYLYDINSPGFEYTQGRGTPSSPANLDFDADGQPGGTIKGFLVPEQIPGEIEAGRATVFIGEGDEGSHTEWGDDYFQVNGTKLWDGINCLNNSSTNPNDAWNSRSYNLNLDGIDIDTFSISWDSHILEEGDVEAAVDLVTSYDGIHVIYVILSFRSLITTGGTLAYLIH